LKKGLTLEQLIRTENARADARGEEQRSKRGVGKANSRWIGNFRQKQKGHSMLCPCVFRVSTLVGLY
jgi:hypothetical protein